MKSSLMRRVSHGALFVFGIYAAAHVNPAVAQVFSANEFVWSYSGPVSGRNCTKINEPSAPRRHKWGDNYLCTLTDWKLEWSYNGPIAGMRCTQVNEPSEPKRRDWDDNYLCVQDSSPLFINWSYNGNSEHDNCIKINEPSEPPRHGWDDNYLCFLDERSGVAREDWAGFYSGVTDGKPLLLNVRPNDLLGNRGLTLELINPDTREVVSSADTLMERGDRTHELRDLVFRWVNEPDRAAKVYPRLYMHTWDKRVISGYSLYNDNTYGAIFHSEGFESGLNPRSYRNGSSKQQICNWIGDYEGYLDGRPLPIKIEYNFISGYDSVAEAKISFVEGPLRFSRYFTLVPAAHHVRLSTIHAYEFTRNDSGSNKNWPNIHLHTWDTSYISGTSEWRGREFGLAFKRVGTQGEVDMSFARCLEDARRPPPRRPPPEEPPISDPDPDPSTSRPRTGNDWSVQCQCRVGTVVPELNQVRVRYCASSSQVSVNGSGVCNIYQRTLPLGSYCQPDIRSGSEPVNLRAECEPVGRVRSN